MMCIAQQVDNVPYDFCLCFSAGQPAIASAEMDFEHSKIGALDMKDAFLQVPSGEAITHCYRHWRVPGAA